MEHLPVSATDVESAAARIRGHVERTPLVGLDATRWRIKCEHLQRTGAFKFRGATNAILALRPTQVVTASSGNHGHALAVAARAAGIPATIVMPAGASAYKRALIEAAGATVVECGPETAAREAATEELAQRDGATIIPPYDHPAIIAGQGTVGLEILEAAELHTIVVPVGGGGLISGIATIVKAGRPDVRIIGVEPAFGDDFVRSRADGRRVTVPVPATICDGARTQTPGALTWPVVEQLVDDLVAIDDDHVRAAVRHLARAGHVVEPTGALALAGARAVDARPGTVIVISGGNVSPEEHARLVSGR